MSIIRSSLVIMGLVLYAGTALAAPPMHPMPPADKACPIGPHHRPYMAKAVPMLLPLAEMHSYLLHLSDSQVSKLAVWQNHHMRAAIPLMKRIQDDRAVLTHDLLQGASRGVVQDIMHRLNKDRSRMLDLQVAQVRIVHETLSPNQWDKLLNLYKHMPMMRLGMMHP